ncbi:MAG: hypothetical protein WA191_06970 [Telluria sp.]
MGNNSVTAVPHVHAEVIKAWADGAKIEFLKRNGDGWERVNNPSFNTDFQYRVKPEKVYPVTQMADTELCLAVPMMHKVRPVPSDCEQFIIDGFRSLANAALRHAIDANQIIAMADHQDALITLGQSLRDVEIARHANRDMAIAKAVRDYITDGWPKSSARYFSAYCESLNLVAIIAKAAP